MKQVIHRYWSGVSEGNNFSRRVAEGLGHEVIDWTDDQIPRTIQDLYDSTVQRVCPEPKHLLRHKSNIVRLWLLYTYGGAWIDHDVYLLSPLEAGTWMAAHGSPCTCVMVFDQPNHILLSTALDVIADSDTINLPSTVASGETLIGKLITPDVKLRQLPFDSVGYPIPNAEPWAVHTYSTSAK